MKLSSDKNFSKTNEKKNSKINDILNNNSILFNNSMLKNYHYSTSKYLNARSSIESIYPSSSNSRQTYLNESKSTLSDSGEDQQEKYISSKNAMNRSHRNVKYDKTGDAIIKILEVPKNSIYQKIPKNWFRAQISVMEQAIITIRKIDELDKPYIFSLKKATVNKPFKAHKHSYWIKIKCFDETQFCLQTCDYISIIKWLEIINFHIYDEDHASISNDSLLSTKSSTTIIHSSNSSNMNNSSCSHASSSSIISNYTSNSFVSVNNEDKKLFNEKSNKEFWPSIVLNKLIKIGSTKSSKNDLINVGQRIPRDISLFGQPIDSYPPSPNNHYVPFIIEHCCSTIENKSLNTVGLYRIPGKTSSVNALRDELSIKPMNLIDFSSDKWQETNSLTSLLKLFLMKLNDSLIPRNKFSELLLALHHEDYNKKLEKFINLIKSLPPFNRHSLNRILYHLKKIVSNSNINKVSKKHYHVMDIVKMEVKNISIIFGPTIIRTPDDGYESLMKYMADQCLCIELFLNEYESIFTVESIFLLKKTTNHPLKIRQSSNISNLNDSKRTNDKNIEQINIDSDLSKSFHHIHHILNFINFVENVVKHRIEYSIATGSSLIENDYNSTCKCSTNEDIIKYSGNIENGKVSPENNIKDKNLSNIQPDKTQDIRVQVSVKEMTKMFNKKIEDSNPNWKPLDSLKSKSQNIKKWSLS